MQKITTLDLGSRIPIYEQIVHSVERYVSVGILKPGEQIPSIRELAQDLGINPNTVKKAYSELEAKGVIYVISTKGYYISNKTDEVIERKIKEKIENIKNLINELEKFGISKENILKRIS